MYYKCSIILYFTLSKIDTCEWDFFHTTKNNMCVSWMCFSLSHQIPLYFMPKSAKSLTYSAFYHALLLLPVLRFLCFFSLLINDFLWWFFKMIHIHYIYITCTLQVNHDLIPKLCFSFVLYIWLNVIHSKPVNKYDYEFDWLIIIIFVAMK